MIWGLSSLNPYAQTELGFSAWGAKQILKYQNAQVWEIASAEGGKLRLPKARSPFRD